MSTQSPVGDGPGPGIALKETCRVAPDRTVPLWSLHRRRLRAGGCSAGVLAGVDDVVAETLAGYNGELSSRVRLTVTVSEDGIARAIIDRRLSSLDVMAGVRAVPVVREQLPELPPGAAKPADRFYWDSAQRSAALADGDQAILLDPEGVVIDGSTASIFYRTGQRLVTPPAPSAVAGVARDWILGHAAGFGYECLVARFGLRDIESAEEVFFSNAYGGIREMRGRGGPACRALGDALGALLSGAADRPL